MRKLITPILYAAFLIPLTGIAVGIEAILRTVGILGEYKGVIDLSLTITFISSIVIIGVPLFWIANMLIQRLEHLQSPKLLDHFRQSLFYYLIAIFSVATWITRGFKNNEDDGYLLLWMGISLVGILINYLFMLMRRKSNVT